MLLSYPHFTFVAQVQGLSVPLPEDLRKSRRYRRIDPQDMYVRAPRRPSCDLLGGRYIEPVREVGCKLFHRCGFCMLKHILLHIHSAAEHFLRTLT